MVQFAVITEGVESIRDIKEIGKDIRLRAVRAINKIARDQRVVASKKIRDQVNLPARSLSPSSGNLTVAQKATKSKLEARIRARGRPTSLARFSTGQPGRAGTTVEVKPGQARFMRRAFLVRLPQGSAITETRFNLGLAMRLRPGEKVSNKIRQVQLAKNLVLLYGPSIQQVFLDNSGGGVAKDIEEPTADKLEKEILRLIGLDR